MPITNLRDVSDGVDRLKSNDNEREFENSSTSKLGKWMGAFAAAALVTTAGSSKAEAGSGPGPEEINANFAPASVVHKAGSAEVHVYGATNDRGTVGQFDAARYTSTSNGNLPWNMNWLTGIGRTEDDEGYTVVSPDWGRVCIHNSDLNRIKCGNLDGTGLNATSVNEIVGVPSRGGLVFVGNNRLATRDLSNQLALIDIATGASSSFNCSVLGAVNHAAGGAAGGFFYTQSNGSGTVGGQDFFRQPFTFNETTGVASCSGSRTNLNSVAAYGIINTSLNERVGAVDQLTGDFYFADSNGVFKVAHHASTCGDGFISGLYLPTGGEQCDPASKWALNAQSCLSLGLPDGELRCNAVTCQFDTSRCTGTPVPDAGTDSGVDAAPNLDGGVDAAPSLVNKIEVFGEKCKLIDLNEAGVGGIQADVQATCRGLFTKAGWRVPTEMVLGNMAQVAVTHTVNFAELAERAINLVPRGVKETIKSQGNPNYWRFGTGAGGILGNEGTDFEIDTTDTKAYKVRVTDGKVCFGVNGDYNNRWTAIDLGAGLGCVPAGYEITFAPDMDGQELKLLGVEKFASSNDGGVLPDGGVLTPDAGVANVPNNPGDKGGCSSAPEGYTDFSGSGFLGLAAAMIAARLGRKRRVGR